MEREIKFRAWDKQKKQMSRADRGTVLGWREDRYVALQFTGLKDKNGVEIYEGDIIKTAFKAGDVTRTCEWSFADAGWRFGGWQYTFDDLQFSEIIGNIFESPELLS